MNETRGLKTTSLSEAVSCVAWGYVFLHLDFNLGGINVLPDWVCYALVLHALPGLARAERSALLLRPLAVILLAVDALMWALQIFGTAPDLYIVSALSTVLELYFHFQLLTNVADIARIDPQRSRSVLRLRNFRTVFVTLLALPWQPGSHELVCPGCVPACHPLCSSDPYNLDVQRAFRREEPRYPGSGRRGEDSRARAVSGTKRHSELEKCAPLW